LLKTQKREVILTVVLDECGLSVELGDYEVDGEVRGHHPTEEFMAALVNEIEFHISNTIRNFEQSRRIYKRLEKSLS
jgi:hypothetical protein